MIYSFFIRNRNLVLCCILICALFGLWSYRGVMEAELNVDLSRDLTEVSNLWIHRIVWLGPTLRVGFPASPIYFYLLFPGVLLSNGNAYSLVITHTLLAGTALLGMAWLLRSNSFVSVLLGTLAIGISPWWIDSASHPWNGHMYVPFVMIALVSLWTKRPLFISAFMLGTAIAIHPAAILVLPILIYEWWSHPKKWVQVPVIGICLLLPWAPILVFEGITKGYLTRQWLSHASSGIHGSLGLGNIALLLGLVKLPVIISIGTWVLTFIIAKSREKHWMIAVTLPVLGLVFISPLLQYYFLGLICAFVFLTVIVWSPKKLGKISLLLVCIWYGYLLLTTPLARAGRSISVNQNRVEETIQQTNLDKSKSYALVSIIDNQHSAPQADDYRFFLRIKGYTVVSIDDFSKADRLLLFLEVPNFDWRNWTDWHMEQFGKRKVQTVVNVNGKEIILYERE